jgi:hypothetical protein
VCLRGSRRRRPSELRGGSAASGASPPQPVSGEVGFSLRGAAMASGDKEGDWRACEGEGSLSRRREVWRGFGLIQNCLEGYII